MISSSAVTRHQFIPEERRNALDSIQLEHMSNMTQKLRDIQARKCFAAVSNEIYKQLDQCLKNNKFTDLIANSLGFYVGLKIRKYFEKENNS